MYFDLKNQIKNNFTKMDALLQFANGGRILIAADSNARSTMWHDAITKSRGRKLEKYLVCKHLHIMNKESERPNFHNSRGTSNIDLTITNNKLIAAVSEWEISAEKSLSNHNYMKYKIVKGANSHNNDNICQAIRYIIKENITILTEN
jgi:hypothetical protein